MRCSALWANRRSLMTAGVSPGNSSASRSVAASRSRLA